MKKKLFFVVAQNEGGKILTYIKMEEGVRGSLLIS
jgi:hypothetical protein